MRQTDLQIFDDIAKRQWVPSYEEALKRIRSVYVEHRKTVAPKRAVQQRKGKTVHSCSKCLRFSGCPSWVQEENKGNCFQ